MPDYAMSAATPKISDRQEYQVSVAWKDAEGNPADTVNAKTSLTAVFTINNLTGTASNKALIVAVYDTENKLKAVKVLPNTEIASGSHTYDVSVDNFTAGSDWSAKAMLWSDMENINPIYCTTLK